jgi:cation:H+ antiporter
MFWSIILFVLGLYILIKGAGTTVRGASALARFFNVSSWIIGILIVGIGTSIPELSINVSSVIKGGQVGIGTILGSNIFNILFILGLTAIVTPLTLKKEWVYRDVILNICAIMIAAFFSFTNMFGDSYAGITRPEGFIIMILFVFWIWYIISLPNSDSTESEVKEQENVTVITAIFLIIVGIIGVLLGGHWVVEGAQIIASNLGIPEAIVSILIVGVGTSIPELAISIQALHKKMGGIAIGNIIGSNIFDFIGIIGIASMFGKISIPQNILFDFLVALLSTIMLLMSMCIGKKFTLERREGVLFILIYLAYILYMIFRLVFSW